MNPIVSTGALYLLSVQIVVEIIGSPATNLRSYNNRISVTEYYRITFGIKICDYRIWKMYQSYSSLRLISRSVL